VLGFLIVAIRHEGKPKTRFMNKTAYKGNRKIDNECIHVMRRLGKPREEGYNIQLPLVETSLHTTRVLIFIIIPCFRQIGSQPVEQKKLA